METQNQSIRNISLLGLVKTTSRSKFYARMIMIIFLLLIPIFLLAPWQQTVVGSGRVVAFAPLERQQFIEAPIDGRIAKWYALEGANVKKGDLIVDISDNDPDFLNRLGEEKVAVESRIMALNSRAESIQMRIQSLKLSRDNGFNAAKSRSAMANDRVESAKHAVEAAEALYRNATINHNRQKNLLAQGLTSQRSLELAEVEEARTLTELNRAKASLSAANAEKMAILSDQSKINTDGNASIEDAKAQYSQVMADLANARAELPRISARLSRQHSQSVRAPRDGTIMRIYPIQGTQMVKTGDPLAVLIPDTEERAAEIWVDGNDIPLITEGRPVRLQFQGWPVVHFSGMPEVSYGTFGGTILLVDTTDNGSGKFRIIVKPDENKEWPPGNFLRQGVRANAWIFLNQVTIGFEFWRRFNAFPPEIPHATSSKKGINYEKTK
jgi:multidrug efflux pump subunit AcrA (membrane-fusion protein)